MFVIQLLYLKVTFNNEINIDSYNFFFCLLYTYFLQLYPIYCNCYIVIPKHQQLVQLNNVRLK